MLRGYGGVSSDCYSLGGGCYAWGYGGGVYGVKGRIRWEAVGT